MMPVTLQAIPLQKTRFVADGQQYDIRVWFDGDDMMYMDVTINGSVVATSCRCIVGQMVLPYSYLESIGGNFIWQTASGNNPTYTNFGAGDVLLYASNAEMSQARAANLAAATAITLAPNQAA
jgi:hypothetical protein